MSLDQYPVRADVQEAADELEAAVARYLAVVGDAEPCAVVEACLLTVKQSSVDFSGAARHRYQCYSLGRAAPDVQIGTLRGAAKAVETRATLAS